MPPRCTPVTTGVQKSGDRQTAAHSAKPHGTLRTCQNCFTAKIRCDQGEEGQPCVRCKRLNKTCQTLPARRRRRNADQDTRIESLEEALKTLLEIHHSPAQATTHPGSLPRSVDGTPSLPPVPPPRSVMTPSTNMNISDTVPSSTPGTSDRLCSHVIPRLLSRSCAERLLLCFTTDMTPHFPFVMLPPDTSLDVLQQEQPLLLLAILAAAAYDDMPLQRCLGREFKQSVTCIMLYGAVMSLEILQALLIHLAWSQYHSRPRRYSQYLQLAISVVIDLRLDRNPDIRPWKTRLDVRNDAADHKMFLGLDEQRAVAGCYYLSCSISKLLQKRCTFPWSLHIEECCTTLYQQQQYPTDKYLFSIVELQHIIEKADCGTFSRPAALDKPAQQDLSGVCPTNDAAIHRLRSTVESIKATLPFSMLESPFLKMQFHTTELYLCLIGVSTNAAVNTLPNEKQWPRWRIELLSAGLVAAKSLLDYYLLQPPRSEKNHNNTEWIQISFALTLAARLTITTNQGPIQQETAYLRSFLGMSGILSEFINRLDAITTEQVDDSGDRDFFFHSSRRLKRLQTWFEARSSYLQYQPPGELDNEYRVSATSGGGATQAVNHRPYSTGELMAGPSMSSSLMQLESSSVWMGDSWLDGLMDFTALDHGSNLEFGVGDWDGMGITY